MCNDIESFQLLIFNKFMLKARHSNISMFVMLLNLKLLPFRKPLKSFS